MVLYNLSTFGNCLNLLFVRKQSFVWLKKIFCSVMTLEQMAQWELFGFASVHCVCMRQETIHSPSRQVLYIHSLFWWHSQDNTPQDWKENDVLETFMAGLFIVIVYILLLVQ